MERIPIAGPSISQREVDYATEAAARGWYDSAGEFPRRFEEAFANYLGVKHAVSLPSCTSGLHLSLAALDIGPGDEVIVPDLTWIASSAPIGYVGATPVFADVDERTWCLCAESVKACLTDRTRAILPVDLYGGVPDYDVLRAIANEHGLKIIEDAAEAIGSEFHGRKAGTLGDVGAFSFHGSKTFTTGEGGMLVTNDGDLAERARKLRWVGISRPTWERFRSGEPRRSWMYEVEEVGYKYEMNDLAAAIGLAQLGRLEHLNGERRRLLTRYREALADVDGVEVVPQRSHAESACYSAVIKCGNRDELYAHLDLEGIDSNVHYYPNHMLSIFRAYTTRLPETEAEWQRILTIPLHPDLSMQDQDRVIDSIRRFAAGESTDVGGLSNSSASA